MSRLEIMLRRRVIQSFAYLIAAVVLQKLVYLARCDHQSLLPDLLFLRSHPTFECAPSVTIQISIHYLLLSQKRCNHNLKSNPLPFRV